MKEKFQIDLFCYYDWIYDTWDVIEKFHNVFQFYYHRKINWISIMMFML